ncbi:MAG: glutamate dehydrogenase [Candidatus Lloydbacteria bacterium RIFCSPHIGHO2_02_FULL_54_17]|uniref:Glutamate dehydrogenase n=1 Tax=Candidatus Lloydbacteria bacterium RIFCSPHIGHO2_02_FULL_54_17 TaxID=1798664 RepID=A0A1G2DJJ3_9BACT|nr:MAG: glutamate dehydrogenase [Candidatus Lloydbacteria bacterium RIFCSPHIGHO2_02_FULL_54_17]OGZ15420.1 MAG: glutamate dehydrogenase [Candidatus Lloydbacteria bacterium RIFCSPLOWO2_01_FULL_54_18]OGZ16257.1 MAG: glutamate dehydrogenase [Candidatus Lloydbacteria bacterium RIFCSPLOWO2_02_FULL_54_12]
MPAPTKVDQFMEAVKRRDPNEPEFHQAVREVAETVLPFIAGNKAYTTARILERMTEPERTVIFRVPWVNDAGGVEINRGYRIQFSSAIGPYKGGLRFHPSVNLSILKFLGFEQVFKNALTTLPMGGGKGGSDFDPKGKSDGEVMRFCQSFMSELYRHIGPDTDVPAGDIGVGGREIGFLFGQYKRIKNEFSGVLTGKGFGWGGSLVRPEATGYGAVYFAEEMLTRKNETLKGKAVLISGSGNVAQHVAEKALRLGAKVLTMSDSSGYIYDKNGMNEEKLAFIKELKNVKRGRIKQYANKFGAKFVKNAKPWGEAGDIAFPCATQNELDIPDAEHLIANKVMAVIEGANMPTTIAATKLLQSKGVLFAPGKASNAGGVAVSGLEMSQNSLRLSWTAEEVDAKLKEIMKNIHATCMKYGKDEKGKVDYVRGANIGGFVRVADAMLAQGYV